MLNIRNNYLVILVATFNRLSQLKKVLDSIYSETKCSHEIIIIDGGSTDGTIEYLQANKNITPVFQGKLIGSARAYNQVWQQIGSKYTCWLSDDTEITNRGLDVAVDILETNPDIGMVGLKMKDTVGPTENEPYKGGFSKYGILNCAHGVLPVSLLANIGYFNEAYAFNGIDPDLTASVLCTGKKVVMTKDVCVLHTREWTKGLTIEEVKNISIKSNKGIDFSKIYNDKFIYLESAIPLGRLLLRKPFRLLEKIVFFKCKPYEKRLGFYPRDWHNLLTGRFILQKEMISGKKKIFHLIQKIPRRFLDHKLNPYHHLIK